MKKVLIATYNNSKNNYGATLQSYALSRFIKKLGYDVWFLTLKKRNKPSFATKKTIKFYIKHFVYKILSLPFYFKTKKREKKFKIFHSKNQQRFFYTDYKELIENPPSADIYLSGSDQVWNPRALYKEFFLSFAPDDKPLISYAASMGDEIIPPENKSLFEKYIARYDSISVREDTMVDIIKKFTNRPIYQNVDPVFLLSKEEWEKIMRPYTKLKYKRYIFLYAVNWNKKYNRKLLQLKKETGLPIVLVKLGGLGRYCADQVILDASPEEFLYLLSNAEMVITSSFHGTAFSIIFNKPFITAPAFKPTRIESLLRHFGLTSQNIVDFNLNNLKINYEKINGQIKIDQATATAYLEKALTIEK